MLLTVVGFDPSLRNWGIAKGLFDSEKNYLIINELDIITPNLTRSKQVRQNSLDIESAKQLYEGAQKHTVGAQAIFVEVPIGSQSARAMASYGLCMGVLGSLRATGIPFFEITPMSVKLVSCNNKQATKAQMIAWGTQHHPEAPWPMQGTKVIACKAEHMADATATIHAGLNDNTFLQWLAVYKQFRKEWNADHSHSK